MTKRRKPAHTLGKGSCLRFCVVCCSYTDGNGNCTCTKPPIDDRDLGDEDDGDDADE